MICIYITPSLPEHLDVRPPDNVYTVSVKHPKSLVLKQKRRRGYFLVPISVSQVSSTPENLLS